MRTLQCFKSNILMAVWISFSLQSQLMAVWIFFLSAAPTAQSSQELKIHIRNVAQDASVYYSVWMMMIPNQIGVVPRRTMYMISKECLMGPKNIKWHFNFHNQGYEFHREYRREVWWSDLCCTFWSWWPPMENPTSWVITAKILFVVVAKAL